MSLRKNIIRARSHIAFVIGICCAAIIATSVETGVATSLRSTDVARIPKSNDQQVLASIGSLTPQDMAYAQIAWQYFENNTQVQTGLVNSANQYPSTTIWDQSSYLLGLISAYRIKLINHTEFDQRMSLVLESLGALPLFDGRLPNKAYDTRTMVMVNYKNEPIERGIGWSALDVARMSVPLNIVLYDYPQHAEKAVAILNSWNFAALIDDGSLIGARVNPQSNLTEMVQEGRLGYEEYGARAAALLGLDALNAVKSDDFLRFERVSGQLVGVDSRSRAEFDAHNYVVSEPYILTALEFGFDTQSQELAHRVFQAQENRYNNSGILTAVSEDNIDEEPYFLYNTVFANGKAWNTLAEDGVEYDDLRSVSTKAAFGWDAIYGSDYTSKLVEHVVKSASQETGWQSGIYELDGRVNAVATANTNAIILESLQYKANGPLVSHRFHKQETR